MNGTILGMTRREIDSKLEEIIDFSGVEKFIDTPVKFYSSGMKVRLGFSVAAHLDPEILIIDEVLAVGDYEFQKKCLGKMKDVAGQGRTVLFVSHNLEAVKSLCDKAILLENGQIFSFGETNKVVNFYLLKDLSQKRIQIWDFISAPGNELVKFKLVEILPEGGNNGDLIYLNNEILIFIEFWMLKGGLSINLSLHLFLQSGECIMANITNLPGPILKEGLHKSICKIPANLLNNGFYYVSIMVVKDGTSVIFNLDSCLEFEIHENIRIGTNWFGKYPGFVRPLIDFKIIE